MRRTRAGLLAAVLTVATVGAIGGGVASAGARAQLAAGGVTEVPMPFSTFGALAVDDEHHHVFVGSYDTEGGISVLDMDGQPVSVLPQTRVLGLSVDATTDSLYVAQVGAITVVDTASLTERISYPLTNLCPRSVVEVGGVLWFGEACGSGGETLMSFDPDVTIGEPGMPGGPGAHGTGIEANEVMHVPGRPGVIVATNTNTTASPITVLDVSSDPAQVLIAKDLQTGFLELGVTGDGQFLVAGGRLLGIDDLVAHGAYLRPTSVVEQAMAVGGGVMVASGGKLFGPQANLVVSELDAEAPRVTFTLSGDVKQHGMAWSGDGKRLYAIVYSEVYDSSTGVTTKKLTLAVVSDERIREAPLTVTVPKRLPLTGPVAVSGRLNVLGAPAGARSLTVTRTDKTGTHPFPAAATDVYGRFSFTDATAVPFGRATYTVSFAGDPAVPAVTTSAWGLREVPWDVNADGFAEVVVGAPGEDIGSDTTTGLFHLLYGRASGLTGTGSVAIHQDTAGVPGSGEDGDQFGFAQASGDFNGDGFGDVAVSANLEDVGAFRDYGAVTIFYGAASGLRTDNAKLLTIQNSGYSGIGQSYFGDTLAAGDFNGDGMDDLAISADGDNIVFVATGSSAGLTLNSSSLRLSGGGSDLFGFSLSAGDVNGDGRADLAVGAPFDYDDLGFPTGAARIFFGSGTGLTTTSQQRLTKETDGVPGSAAPFGTNNMPDWFGYQVVLADFSGDGKADLAVGAPGAPVTSGGSVREDAGTVTILYSTGSRIGTPGAVEVTQNTGSMPGSPVKGDQLGLTLAAGDATGDRLEDLAIYSGDGYVAVVPGKAGALDFTKAKGWTQNSTGVPGSSETGDAWGASLRFISPLGIAKPAGLLVGAPGENSGAGAITFLPSAAGTGLTGTGSQYFSQNSAGIPGSSESGDVFGTFY
jgi:hypothetical protein